MAKLVTRLTKFHSILNGLRISLDKFATVQATDMHEICRDSVIKRFELCNELAWKACKDYLLEGPGIVAASPRAVYKALVDVSLITDVESLQLITMNLDRNEAAHGYDEQETERMVIRIAGYYQIMASLANRLTQASEVK